MGDVTKILKELWEEHGRLRSAVICVEGVLLFPRRRPRGRRDVCRFGRVKKTESAVASHCFLLVSPSLPCLFCPVPCSLFCDRPTDPLFPSVFGLPRLKISSKFGGDSVKNSRTTDSGSFSRSGVAVAICCFRLLRLPPPLPIPLHISSPFLAPPPSLFIALRHLGATAAQRCFPHLNRNERLAHVVLALPPIFFNCPCFVSRPRWLLRDCWGEFHPDFQLILGTWRHFLERGSRAWRPNTAVEFRNGCLSPMPNQQVA